MARASRYVYSRYDTKEDAQDALIELKALGEIDGDDKPRVHRKVDSWFITLQDRAA